MLTCFPCWLGCGSPEDYGGLQEGRGTAPWLRPKSTNALFTSIGGLPLLRLASRLPLSVKVQCAVLGVAFCRYLTQNSFSDRVLFSERLFWWPRRTKEDRMDVRREMDIMYHLQGHDNIVELVDAYEDKEDVHLIGESLIFCIRSHKFHKAIA
eukprot:9468263-Pyramimonas_sp.AAC.2